MRMLFWSIGREFGHWRGSDRLSRHGYTLPMYGVSQAVRCRVLRRRKLARERRSKDLEGYRADERVRQRQRRARLQAPCAQGGSGGETLECHVPASALKSSELQEEIHRILDGPFRMSRAGFGRELLRIERKLSSIVRQAVAQYGP